MASTTDTRRREAPGALEKLFVRLVYRSFDELRVGNLEIRDYVTDLLCRFARTDALYRVHDIRGKRIETVVELLVESERLRAESALHRERDVRRHTGDYALFMTGIFRAYVERHGVFDLYLESGAKAYRDASELERRLFGPDAQRFSVLSDQFERISGAIDYMRKVYFGHAMMHGELGEIARRFSLWN